MDASFQKSASMATGKAKFCAVCLQTAGNNAFARKSNEISSVQCAEREAPVSVRFEGGSDVVSGVLTSPAITGFRFPPVSDGGNVRNVFCDRQNDWGVSEWLAFKQLFKLTRVLGIAAT